MLPPSPMLALRYPGHVPAGRVFSQPKLDGVRCLADARGLWSRSGRRITSCVHVEEALAPFFALHPSAVMDGELYGHDLRDDLNSIISFVNAKSLSTDRQAACASLLQLHVFDAPSIYGNFSQRWAALADIFHVEFSMAGPIRLVETACLDGDVQSRLDELYQSYQSRGFEGQIVRADAPYVAGRSPALLKRKPSLDEEFLVCSVQPARTSGEPYASRVTLKLTDGRTFGATIAGDRARAAELLADCPSVATVRYSGLTPSGIPRCPVAVAFHAHDRSF